jgi:hypothetical protein
MDITRKNDTEGDTMKKRICAGFALILCLLVPLLAACAGGPSPRSGNSQQVVVREGNELYVLDSYADAGQSSGSQHIVVLPLGTAKPTARLMLPAGLTDLKHQQLYVASPLSGGRTTISVLDTNSGATVRTFSLAGSYSTADRGYVDSMLSADGRWLALREQGTPAGTTSIALVDTQAGRLVKTIHLGGDFTLDAVSPRGTMLYLLEFYQAGTSHYNVRAYNVQAGVLVPGSIVDKNELDEKMEGKALARQMSDDGDMAYTLYINTVTNKAFIHILWLADTIDNNVPFPTIARCIDLPVGSNPALLRYYTLTLARDGQTLYAVNAALGLVATVNLGTNIYQPWTIPNARTARFTPDNGAVAAADQARVLYNGAVLSPDQTLLYVAGLHGIRVLNTRTLKPQNEYLKQQNFTGLAISRDGQTLYAVGPTTGITLLDAASGATRSVIRGQVHAPWGIEWTSDQAAS